MTNKEVIEGMAKAHWNALSIPNVNDWYVCPEVRKECISEMKAVIAYLSSIGYQIISKGVTPEMYDIGEKERIECSGDATDIFETMSQAGRVSVD